MSVFEVRSSDEESTLANDRFSKADGYHVNSDDENDVSEVSPVKTNETQTAKTQVDKIGQTSKKAGIGFKKIKACFVCKSTDHLIKDCDFYDKKSPEPKLKNVVNTGQRVVKPVWDNAKRVNHQKISNKLNYPQARRTFVPSGVLTRTGLVNPVRPNEKRAVQTINTARPVSTARSVSTARPFAPKTAQTSSAVRPIYPRMDNVRPRASSSQIKRSYNTKPVFRPKDLKQDVKTSGVNNMTTAGTRAVVSSGEGKMDNTVKKSRWVWRPKGNYMDHESKENGSFMLKKFEYVDPKGISKSVDHAVVDSGCSSHMTGNKAYLSDYEDYNGGFVAFGSDPKGALERMMLYCLDLKNIVPSGRDVAKKWHALLWMMYKAKPLRRKVGKVITKRAAQAPILTKLNTEDVSNAFPNDGIFSGAYDDDDVGAEADFNNMDHTIDVSPIPTLRIHKVHLKDQILGDPKLAVQTRGKIQKASSVQQALKVLDTVDFGHLGKRQEEGIDYDEVFAPVARIEAIRFQSLKSFTLKCSKTIFSFLDSGYGGDSRDRKIKQQVECQFLGRRCYLAIQKQTIVAIFTTE
ncbi:hypothetical protein Tco_1044058 [Tanacetum coccineum]|uniref:Retrovirus-related Pol polyprotein from transposon TNT 1-94-like beta-barrel domain-containing protein n=1 Tax=Tanacetum coccineum TaxID=301880 RepID=A0ABQ5GRF0_9ASTR